jgi:dTDP-4-amino-4,6-dideoxygalactose transaminase
MAALGKTSAIPLLDLTRQLAGIREEVMREVARVIDSQRFILGADVEAFEADFAAYCHSPHSIGCASGTDALSLALLALGVGPGDEVLTVPYTFFATVGTIMDLGAKPVFVDVDAETFNLDAAQLAEVRKRHPNLKAAVPVDLFGACADWDAIRQALPGVPLVEDAAQAVGAEYKGRRAGELGDIACFSFFPTKNLGGFGDGGMLTTADAEHARMLKMLRVHGSRERYRHEYPGRNSRLDALQAAVLRVKLRYLDAWTEGRQRNAALYDQLLAPTPVIRPQAAPYQTRHVYNQYVIRCPQRDELRAYLQARGIGTEIYYPIPMHRQPALESFGFSEGDFPVSEQLARETLALPIFPELTSDEIAGVASAIGEFYGHRL